MVPSIHQNVYRGIQVEFISWENDFRQHCSKAVCVDEDRVYTADSRNYGMENGDSHGVLNAGGNGQGNQLNRPWFIFIDQDQSLYISDC